MEIYELPELAAWGPDMEVLQRVALRMEEVVESRLVLNDAQRDQQLTAALQRAAEEYFTPERCAAARRLLLDTAHIVQIRGRGRHAVLLRRAADAFEAAPEQVVASPLAIRLFERRLRRPAAEAADTAEDSAPAPAGTDRSPGGIFIPGKNH